MRLLGLHQRERPVTVAVLELVAEVFPMAGALDRNSDIVRMSSRRFLALRRDAAQLDGLPRPAPTLIHLRPGSGGGSSLQSVTQEGGISRCCPPESGHYSAGGGCP